MTLITLVTWHWLHWSPGHKTLITSISWIWLRWSPEFDYIDLLKLITLIFWRWLHLSNGHEALIALITWRWLHWSPGVDYTDHLALTTLITWRWLHWSHFKTVHNARAKLCSFKEEAVAVWTFRENGAERIHISMVKVGFCHIVVLYCIVLYW